MSVHEEKAGGLTIRIEEDSDPQSPQELGDDALFLIANHRSFYIEPPKGSTFESVREDHKKTHHVFGLEAYIHSGVALALSSEGNFPDRQWDVSQLGLVFVSKKEWKTREEAKKAALSLIEEWNDYLSGSVYGYIVEDERGEHIDSCWGFYGDYKTGALPEARGAAEYHNKPENVKKRMEEQKASDIAAASRLVSQYGLTIA